MSSRMVRSGSYGEKKSSFTAWEIWFDRWWKLAKSEIQSACDYGCDPLLLALVLYEYSSPAKGRIDVVRRDLKTLYGDVEKLMLQMLRAAKQAEALEQRFPRRWLLETPDLLSEVAARLYADLELLGKIAKRLTRLSSRSGISRNYLLVYLDEYMKSVSGRYRRILLAYMVWAANAAHLTTGEEDKAVSPTDDAVAKATKDLSKKQPQTYAAILREVQRVPGTLRMDSILERASLIVNTKAPL